MSEQHISIGGAVKAVRHRESGVRTNDGRDPMPRVELVIELDNGDTITLAGNELVHDDVTTAGRYRVAMVEVRLPPGWVLR